MTQLSKGLWMAAGMVLVCHLGVVWIRAGYDFQVQPPAKELADLPLEIGSWRGVDQPFDDRMAGVLRATAQLNRRYTGPNGATVLIHVALWADEEEVCSAAPHHPVVCYSATGWEVLDRRVVQLDTPWGTLPMSFHLMQQSGERIVIAHWYQMGEHRFTSRSESRAVLAKLWGNPQWPTLCKIMLQTRAQDIQSARPHLEKFASGILHWTADLQGAALGAAQGAAQGAAVSS